MLNSSSLAVQCGQSPVPSVCTHLVCTCSSLLPAMLLWQMPWYFYYPSTIRNYALFNYYHPVLKLCYDCGYSSGINCLYLFVSLKNENKLRQLISLSYSTYMYIHHCPTVGIRTYVYLFFIFLMLLQLWEVHVDHLLSCQLELTIS